MSDPYEHVRGMLRTGSTRHAAELVRLGWTFLSQYPDDEPAEIRLRWEGEGEAPKPLDDRDSWETPQGEYDLRSKHKPVEKPE